MELVSFFIAYFGTYRLGRLVAGRATAILIALLYLLWGGRWVRTNGHLHILLGSALLPWLILLVERALHAGRNWPRWAIAAGAVWALAISFSLYFIWIGLALVAAWLLGSVLTRRITPKSAILHLLVTGGAALLICAPYLYLYLRSQPDVVGYNVDHLNSWSLSLDWLPALFPVHPVAVLNDLANWQINGVRNEASFSGFGIILLALAALGLSMRGRRPAQWGGILLSVAAGIILALGMTLQWGGASVSWSALQPLNEALWDVGHALKPDVFPGQNALPPFDTAVPLPGLLLTILVPFFEGARVPARYLLVAAPGVLLLVALGLERLPRWWLKLLIAILLLIEAARWPITGVPFPPSSHPAFGWLADRSLAPGESVLDIAVPVQTIFVPGVGGEVLWASTLHDQPIAGGGGSILPAHTTYLRDWLFTHADPAEAAEFPWLLRGYGIRYLLLHMPPEPSDAVQRLATGTTDLQAHGCFENSAGLPWDYPICILEVTPYALPAINVFPADNWSTEEWGMWATGRNSAIRWISTDGEEARLAVEAFPFCIEGVPQQMDVIVAGQTLASHRWDDCAPWQGEVIVPPELVDVGWNEIDLRFDRADRPVDISDGQNPDVRELSVGFTRFELLP
jgi:hypothetical protein